MNLDVWLMVENRRKGRRLSVSHACELIVKDAKARRAQANKELKQLKSKEANLPDGVLAARHKAAKGQEDAKWSEAEWFETTLRHFDEQHAYLLGSPRTLSNHYYYAENLRRTDPVVAAYLARALKRDRQPASADAS